MDEKSTAKRWKKWAVGIGIPLVALLAAGTVVVNRYPLEIHELQTKYELWRWGVTEFVSNGVHGYEQDTCAQAPAARQGECTCVALIHGLGDNALTWKRMLLLPYKAWDQPIKLFAFDLPGSGKTPPPAQKEGYRARKQAETLANAMAPLCQSWVVAGNSFGGWIAAWLALDWKSRVSRLLLVDSAGLKPQDGGAEARSWFGEPTVEALKDFQRKAYAHPRPLPDNVWREAVENMKRGSSRAIMEAQTPEDFLDDRLMSLRQPTLLLWGKADQITPEAQGLKMHGLIRGSAWREVNDCGHLPQKECPFDLGRAIVDIVRAGAA